MCWGLLTSLESREPLRYDGLILSVAKQVMMNPTVAAEDVLVIGAGPAGIASAYALQQAGIRYKVVDRAQEIAHTWNSLYPSLKLNTSRYYSHMPEMPFPTEYGLFATGKQYHRYLRQFVADHNFNIELGVEVRRVVPDAGLWRVETDQTVQHYRAVISATGIYDNPQLPNIPGMDAFKGELYHAHDFNEPDQVAGKRVLVVGNGPSGVDISVASSAVAASTHTAIRSGVKLGRRYPLGFAKHTWLLLGEHLPKAWCRRLLKWVGQFDYGDTTQYGLHAPAPGSGGMTGYQGPELLNAVKAGQVTPMVGPDYLTESGVVFADGQTHDYDVIIMATGYRPVLHSYLAVEMQYNDDPWRPQSACDWEIGPNGQRGWPLRDTSVHPNGRQVLGHPGLYLVGVFYKGKGAMFNMNVEAQIAAEQIKAYLAAMPELTQVADLEKQRLG